MVNHARFWALRPQFESERGYFSHSQKTILIKPTPLHYLVNCPCSVVRLITQPSQGCDPGSNPGRGTPSQVHIPYRIQATTNYQKELSDFFIYFRILRLKCLSPFLYIGFQYNGNPYKLAYFTLSHEKRSYFKCS